MPMSAATLLGSYRYDALNRLADCTPAGMDAVRRFYLKDRTACELQGRSGRSIAQAEHWLLAIIATDAAANQNALLATDQSRSVLHSLNDQQRHTCAYPPYGTSAQTAPSVLTGYTGQIPDPVTGHFLLGNGYRAFNPVLMRFNSPDTVSPFDEGGFNAYAYCQGDPVNYMDPSGRFPIGALGMLSVRLRKVLPAVVKRASLSDEDGIFQTVRQALERKVVAPAPITPTREYLRSATQGLDKQSPFVQKLASVNLNLASHGDTNLTLQQAMDYAALAKQVSTGKMSNSGAHIHAAAMWAQKLRTEGKSPTSMVGLAFNLAGAMTSGVRDHALLKTGALLRRGS
ncbi:MULTISPECIES: RHS repeat-associated core domain-containing protein [Pseudomonas syringae group]|uniref:RHS repeat-associated core domain-containing protein n=2 Tax=Pseudomonas syringae group TaxID=136849 RepID=A0ABX6HII3_9PSED|nr:RHS repeat-associated core domain-containing protein [Pseudomonas asturiensis]QHF05379.1 RHS repeat-associated core domain-containing protein [Pseudomonas asturiensis]